MKMNIGLICDEHGKPKLDPIDIDFSSGQLGLVDPKELDGEGGTLILDVNNSCDFCSVREWLGGKFSDAKSADEIALQTHKRCLAYTQAMQLYLETAFDIYTSTDPLRHQPFILRGKYGHWLFVFKADNNGNSYRIMYHEM